MNKVRPRDTRVRGSGDRGRPSPAPARLAGWLGAGAVLAIVTTAGFGQEPPADETTIQPTTVPTTTPSIVPVTEEEDGEKDDLSLGGMSLDELLDTEVTLVSKRPQKIAESASAIQIVTGAEIRRSGAMTLPEALRLLPNLQVAQINAHDWAITARGFNGAQLATYALSNKLLVMVDGRSVYTPLFAGVFWDVQNVLLEDVDRIEAVSGPGGTLWGANATNGVINVVTKSARDTQGLYMTSAFGSQWKTYGALRYGDRLGEDLYFRVYAMGFQHKGAELPNGGSARDDWDLHQGGFRIDYYPTEANTFTLQGDIYDGKENHPPAVNVTGGNILGRWTHTFSDESDFILQVYFDGNWRQLPGPDFDDAMRTVDVDFQHRFPLAERHDILWGVGYRAAANEVDNTAVFSIVPVTRTLNLFNAFIQDEIQLIPNRLSLTVGAKVEHNDYSGTEFQPSGRLAWTPAERHTVWTAVSRAVRSPSRFDEDAVLPFLVAPGGFESEKLIAYEVGYRVRPVDPVSLSIAGFYNCYDDLRSVNVNPATPGVFVFSNDQEAETWGIELSGDVQIKSWWRVRGGYTFMDKRIRSTDPAVLPASGSVEGNDPHNQVLLQSMMDLPENFQLDLTARYVDSLPDPGVPSYFSLDARLAWHYRNVEVAIVGQNLLDDQHPEFGTIEIPRSIYGSLTVRW